MAENASLKSTVEKMQVAAATAARHELAAAAVSVGNCKIYSGVLEKTPAETLKNIAHQIRQSDGRSIIILGSENEGKASLVIGLGDEAASLTGLNANEMIRAVAAEINGGGGGQLHLATAGGKRPEGLKEAVTKAVTLARKML